MSIEIVSNRSRNSVLMNCIEKEHGQLPATVSLTEGPSESLRNHSLGLESKWQRMDSSLTSAVAPLLKKPLAPFQKTEKARAFKSAVYYSECFLKGVTPNDADKAALDVNYQYDKWWLKPSHFSRERNATLPATGGDDVSITSLKRKYTSGELSEIKGEYKSSRRRSESSIVNLSLMEKVSPKVYDSGAISVSVVEDEIENTEEQYNTVDIPYRGMMDAFEVQDIPNLSTMSVKQVHGIRDEIIRRLQMNGGDVDDKMVQSGLSILESYYLTLDLDARFDDAESFPYHLDGVWLTLSKPTYTECQGKNQQDESLYSLGRMSFDMFRPTNLKCSIQGTFNTVQLLDSSKGELPYSMPRRIRKELGKSLQEGVKGLRTYNIVVAFTIEPHQSRAGSPASLCLSSDYIIPRSISGILTNYGYLLPDPNVPNRLSVWFTGGSLEVNDEEKDLEEWKRIFGKDAPNRDMSEFARVLAAKVLLGVTMSDEIEENGTLSYNMQRPIGGHGTAFCDVIYLDSKIRVMRGHGGSIFVFQKVKKR